MKDYTVHCYDPKAEVYDQVYVLAANRERARLMVRELYPDWDVQNVIEEGEW